MKQEQPKKKPMVRNEYLVQVQIVEARNLKGKDGSGTCDPFIRITVGNLPPQVTTTKLAAATAVFNQSFTFTGLQMNANEFESFEIKIEVMDFRQFYQNQLIGQYSIGLSTLFRNPNHEVFNTWLPLTHPKEGLEPQGFLLVSAYIISPEDRPPVHDMNENNVDEEPDEFGGKPDDQLTAEELMRRREKKNQIAIVGKPELYGKSYQLMVNIVKAEDLSIMSFGSCDSFVAVRAGGYTQRSPVMKNQQKPQYSSRLMFPLYFPVFNDKIVIRVWDKRVCMTDVFIAMVPEVPTENDFFNINFLQSRGGVMPFRWFNLYGIPADERPSNFEEMFLGYKKQMIGTDYMGRVLMSLNLTPSEKPDLMVVPLSTFREPPMIRYTCRVDVYEVQEAKECGETVVVKVKIGSQVIVSPKAKMKVRKANNKKKQMEEEAKKPTEGQTYIWKEKEILLDDRKVELPQDGQQIPDMIVSLYNDQNKRVAYLRIPYYSMDLETNSPKWYTLKQIKLKGSSGVQDVSHSFILVNFMLRPEQTIAGIPRIPVKRNIKSNYNLHAFIYGGYDFCPDCYSEDVEIYFEIKIAQYVIKLDKIVPGKNPIWNKSFHRGDISIDERLEFASNLIINFQNNSPNKQKEWFSDSHIGEICIQAINCGIPPQEKPFVLEQFQPDFKFYHVTTSGNSAGRILAAFHLEKLKQNQTPKAIPPPIEPQPIFKNDKFQHLNILFPVFGVRKLPARMKDPIMNIRVPKPSQFAQDNAYYFTQTIGVIDSQKNDPSNASTWFGGGISDPNFLKVVTLEVYLPPDLRFYPCLEIELRDQGKSNERFICSISLIQLEKKIDMLTLARALQFFNHGKEVKDTEDQEGQAKGKEEEGKEESDDENHHPPAQAATTAAAANQPQKQEQKQDQQDAAKPTVTTIVRKDNTVKDRTIPNRILNKGIYNVLVDDIMEVALTVEDFDQIKQENTWKTDKLKELITKLPKTGSGFEQVKSHVNREIDRLKNTLVSEDQFFGLNQDDDDDDGYDYGRPVIKGPYEEQIAKSIPFKRFPLYRLTNSKHGIIGNPTNAVIKGDLKLQPISHATTKKSKLSKISGNSKQTKKSKSSKVQAQFDPNVTPKYTFNLFDQYFLDFFNGVYKLKIRVYILRCLNLAAQSNKIDTHHMLAGMDAVCSANPYPEITIGEGNRGNLDLIKHVSDADKFVENNLSPGFFRMYELDGELPRDWKMTLHIKNKGMMDSIIGTVEIDIEDRVVGEEKLKERIAFSVYKERYMAEFDQLKYAYDAVAEVKKNWLKAQITDLGQKIESFDKANYKIPVEYKDLKNEGKNQTSQGTVEMFVEVLPLDIARDIPPSNLNPPAPMEYEVRLIILETFEIPKTAPKKVVDIFLKASMDATATGTNKEIQKETDTHMGSEDGNGQFNWRMKFPLLVPSQFPRIKLNAYDMSTFSADEAIGEATISLKRIMNRLKTDGKYEMPPTKIKLSHPNFPDQNRGEVLIQINILTKQAAEAEPVGEAQEEPNINPYLEKPTAGRGLADFFKGMGGGFGNFMLYVKIFAGVFIGVVLIMILFVKPGILVN